MKAVSEACIRNKEPIAKILEQFIPTAKRSRLLEIASGTGQHAYYFSKKFPNCQWQTSDLKNRHPSILSWGEEAEENFLAPKLCDLNNIYPLIEEEEENYHFVFTSNLLHIVGKKLIPNYFRLVDTLLQDRGLCFVYGPFNRDGKFTSDSNREFNDWLKKEVSPESAIRDLEEIEKLAWDRQLKLINTYEMPANNFMLVFEKQEVHND